MIGLFSGGFCFCFAQVLEICPSVVEIGLEWTRMSVVRSREQQMALAGRIQKDNRKCQVTVKGWVGVSDCQKMSCCCRILDLYTCQLQGRFFLSLPNHQYSQITICDEINVETDRSQNLDFYIFSPDYRHLQDTHTHTCTHASTKHIHTQAVFINYRSIEWLK